MSSYASNFSTENLGIRSSRSYLAPQWVLGQPGIHGALFRGGEKESNAEGMLRYSVWMLGDNRVCGRPGWAKGRGTAQED